MSSHAVTTGNSKTYLFELIYMDVSGVTLDKTTKQTVRLNKSVAFTANVSPNNASNKTVKWSVSNSNVKLYSDSACTTEVGTDETNTLTVYAKGISMGDATITVTSFADNSKTASCDVTVVANWFVGETFNMVGKYAYWNDAPNFAEQINEIVTECQVPEPKYCVPDSYGYYNQWEFEDIIHTSCIRLTPPDGKNNRNIVPTGFKIKSGDGTESDPYRFELIYDTPPAISVTSVTLDKTAKQTVKVEESVAFTANVSPNNATDKTVKWSVSNSNVKLYSDSACTTEVGTDATSTLTVYAKGVSAGDALVTVTSNSDSTKTASCDVTAVDTWYVGDTFNMVGKYIVFDDTTTDIFGDSFRITSTYTVPTPVYHNDNAQWLFDFVDTSRCLYLTPPNGKKDSDIVPAGFKIKSGDGTHESPYLFELVYYTKHDEVPATCITAGNIEYYTDENGKYYTKSDNTYNEITQAQT
ncbi:MAG: hypothetical protein II059_08770, partial [Clostridia bacterium]|nr:hypothetical protein [Clostridia bacterium]